MKGLKVGHVGNAEHGTGVSVFLFEETATGAYWICGSAPASHEIAALDPDNSVPHLHGLVFAGGSAYGLFAAQGVMTYLTERGIGHPTIHGVVPIVPASAIYDLTYKKPLPPTASDAYQACVSAQENNHARGRIGAGTGATVGKIIPNAKFMSGGVGYAELKLSDGAVVMAYAVTNSVGDILDEKNNIIAGARGEQGEFLNCTRYLLSGKIEKDFFKKMKGNTTLLVVITNAQFSKMDLKRLAKMAIAGMARAVSPSFTRFDGDILFFISIGDKVVSDLTIGSMAAEVVRLAIVNSVKDAVVLS